MQSEIVLTSVERFHAIGEGIKFDPNGQLWDETKGGEWSDVVSNFGLV